MISPAGEINYSGLFSQNKSLIKRMGAHPIKEKGKLVAFCFSVWAPNAAEVSVIGSFNGWDGFKSKMHPQENGVWSTTIKGVPSGASYKFLIRSRFGETFYRNDPCMKYADFHPMSASKCWASSFRWSDPQYREKQKNSSALNAKPMVIYEVHAGSWRKSKRGGPMNYRELADSLCAYLLEYGFTHVEFMPIFKSSHESSWGYHTTGFFAPSSRYGTPDDLKYLINLMHKNDIGVIFDWVPAYFSKDEGGLHLFDGSPLFEPQNESAAGLSQEGVLRFDFSKELTCDFLISNALYWYSEFHIDGLNISTVSSMIHPNIGLDSIDNSAIEFIRLLNTQVRERFPYALMIAEESTDFPGVTKPVYEGGLGFTHKRNTRWTNDTLKYMQTDPLLRSGLHSLMSFSLVDAFTERHILALSHNECVSGKNSIINKMFGDDFHKFASLRSYLTYMFTHPGNKLLFMGTEFGQATEWKHYEALHWALLELENHQKLSCFVRELIHFYHKNKALWKNDDSWSGFMWSNADDIIFDVYSYFRIGDNDEILLVILNTTPVYRQDYYIGTEYDGVYTLEFNTDDKKYYGGGCKVKNEIISENLPQGNFQKRLCASLPPSSALIYRLSK